MTKKSPFSFAERPRAFTPRPDALVEAGPEVMPRGFPLVRVPATSHVDLETWIGAHQDEVHKDLNSSGAVLFRGFDIGGHACFEAIFSAFAGPLLAYTERSSPRTALGKRSYTSTEYPPDQSIFPHCENSYAASWPRWIGFFCMTVAEDGGATPLVDLMRLADRVGDPLLSLFARKGLRYRRVYGGPIGMGWQEAFQTDSPAEVEALCHQRGLQFQWRDDGALETVRTVPAMRRHPDLNVPVWFNHAAFFHPTALPDAFRGLPPEQLPSTVTFADGTPIPDDEAQTLHAAFAEESERFSWQRNDLLILDNMRVAHGRDPFRGDRKIAVAMAGPLSDETCAAANPDTGLDREGG